MITPPPYLLSLRSALGVCAAIAMFFAPMSAAQDVAATSTADFNQRHDVCLDAVTDSPEKGYEQALRWQNEGGGFRAQHCIAMALFGLGRTELAAHRMERLGRSPYGVTDGQRANFYFEAVGFWILANDFTKARAAANAGLDLRPEHLELLMARARAGVNLKDYKTAKTDLDRAVKLAPHRAEAYRYRADLHLKQDNHAAALRDIEKSLALDDSKVETAVLRGDIREAMRKAEAREIETKLDIGPPTRPESTSGNLALPPFANERSSPGAKDDG